MRPAIKNSTSFCPAYISTGGASDRTTLDYFNCDNSEPADPFYDTAKRIDKTTTVIAVRPGKESNVHLFDAAYLSNDPELKIGELINKLVNLKLFNEDLALKMLLEKLNVMEFDKIEPEDQRKLITAIYEGKFGYDKDVLVKLAEALGKMNISDAAAQCNLTNAIREGRFGKDKDVLVKLAEALGKMNISDAAAQYNLTNAIREGRFSKDKDVLVKLAEALGKMNVSDAAAQYNLTAAIHEGRFGKDKDVLVKLAEALGKMNISDAAAQYNLTNAIHEGRFGKDKDVLVKLAEALGKMNISDAAAQCNLTNAIRYGNFGNDKDVLVKLAEALGKMNISDAAAQRNLTDTICIGGFGNDKDMLVKLAEALGKMNISDAAAQCNLTNAIREGRFGKDKDVLVKLAEALGKMNISDAAAQCNLTAAIRYGNFGKDKDVLVKLAEALGKMNISDAAAQRSLTAAIRYGNFGNDKDVLVKLAEALGKMNISDAAAQRSLTAAIRFGRFGADHVVLKKLAVILNKIPLFDLDARKNLMVGLLEKGVFDTVPSLLLQVRINMHEPEDQMKWISKLLRIIPATMFSDEIKQQILQSWIIKEDRTLAELTEMLKLSENKILPIFGRLKKIEDIQPQNEIKKVKVSGVEFDITATLEDITSYGIITLNNENFLICYMDQRKDFNHVEIDFRGVFSFSEFSNVLYGDASTRLRLYQLDCRAANGSSGAKYPMLCEDWQNVTQSPECPAWLKEVIILHGKFKVEDYVSKDIIKCVMDFIKIRVSDNELQKICVRMIECIIKSRGFDIKFLDMASLSERLNQALCGAVTAAELVEYATRTPEIGEYFGLYWNSASFDNKLKFIYFFLHLAKSGGLGYGHGETADNGVNEANKMFYLLAGHFLQKLIGDKDFNSLSAEKQAVLNTLRNDHGKGGCAGTSALTLSNNFTTVSTMWDKVI